MSPELQKRLYDKYPKMFVHHGDSPMQSCMCWGFECDDGWYHLLEGLCLALSNPYSTSINLEDKEARWYSHYLFRTKAWNKIRTFLVRNLNRFANFVLKLVQILPYNRHILKLLERRKINYRLLTPPQVIADQVKEKFGTLRFYYHYEWGEEEKALFETHKEKMAKISDEYSRFFDGCVHMAEIMSEITCEITGKPGVMHYSDSGWIKVLNPEFAATDEFCKSRGYKPNPEESTKGE